MENFPRKFRSRLTLVADFAHGIQGRTEDVVSEHMANYDQLHLKSGEVVARKERVSIVLWTV